MSFAPFAPLAANHISSLSKNPFVVAGVSGIFGEQFVVVTDSGIKHYSSEWARGWGPYTSSAQFGLIICLFYVGLFGVLLNIHFHALEEKFKGKKQIEEKCRRKEKK